MTLGFSPNSDTGPIPTQLVFAGFLLLFIHLLTNQENAVLYLSLVVIVALLTVSPAPRYS